MLRRMVSLFCDCEAVDALLFQGSCPATGATEICVTETGRSRQYAGEAGPASGDGDAGGVPHPESVQDAEAPALEVREHAVDPLEDFMRRPVSDRDRRVVLQPVAAGPAVGRDLVADFSQIVPYFADGKETFKVCRPAAGPRTFSFVQFNEFRNRLLSPLDGIVDAAPEPASIKWTLMSRTCHQVPGVVASSRNAFSVGPDWSMILRSSAQPGLFSPNTSTGPAIISRPSRLRPPGGGSEPLRR